MDEALTRGDDEGRWNATALLVRDGDAQRVVSVAAEALIDFMVWVIKERFVWLCQNKMMLCASHKQYCLLEGHKLF